MLTHKTHRADRSATSHRIDNGPSAAEKLVAEMGKLEKKTEEARKAIHKQHRLCDVVGLSEKGGRLGVTQVCKTVVEATARLKKNLGADLDNNAGGVASAVVLPELARFMIDNKAAIDQTWGLVQVFDRLDLRCTAAHAGKQQLVGGKPVAWKSTAWDCDSGIRQDGAYTVLYRG